MIVWVMRGAALTEIEAVYRGEFHRFVRVATAVLRDEDAAVDAVHDAFATAIRSRTRYRGEGPLEAWIWRIVLNTARRARPERQEPPGRQNGAAVSAPDAGPVRDAIARLPERQRLTLFLRYYADLDYASIAAALDVRPGTVAATLNAAHAALRAQLQEVRP
jgi:RNA polymerase sigma-70 factor (ECF subfamily)